MPRDAEEHWRRTRPTLRPTSVFAGVAVAVASHLTLSMLFIAAAASLASARAGGAPLSLSNAVRGAVCLASLCTSLFVGASVAGLGARTRSRTAGLAEGAVVWALCALVLFIAVSSGFDAACGFDPAAGANHAADGPRLEVAGEPTETALGIVRSLGRTGQRAVASMLALTSLAAAAGAAAGARLRRRR